MTVGIIVAALAGLAVGAGLVYWWMQQSWTAREFQHEKELRRCREDLERDFELRMQAAIEPVQRQRDREVTQLQEEIKRLKGRPAAVERSSTPPVDDSAAVAPPADTPAAMTAPAATPPLPDPWGGAARSPESAAPVPAAPPTATEAVPEPAGAAATVPDAAATPKDRAIATPAADTVSDPATTASAIAKAATWAERVRRQGLRADTRKQLDAMGALVRDRDASVRVAAIEALGRSGAPDVRRYLEAALRDPNLAVVRAATIALDRCRRAAAPPGPAGSPQPSKAKPANAKPSRPPQA